MLKLHGKNVASGRQMVLLGIDENNVRQLKLGNPIHVFTDEMGMEIKVEIIIHYEATLEKLNEVFAPLIGPETRVRDHRREKKN